MNPQAPTTLPTSQQETIEMAQQFAAMDSSTFNAAAGGIVILIAAAVVWALFGNN